MTATTAWLPDYAKLPEFIGFARSIHSDVKDATNKGVMADWLEELGYEEQATELRSQMSVRDYSCGGFMYHCFESYMKAGTIKDKLETFAFSEGGICGGCRDWCRLLLIVGEREKN